MLNVSVIMPVYNSEKFLRGAINSVLAQDFQDFELILVDDGSKDNSGKICDEYAQIDSRVRVIHKKNGGICSARNAGLDVAKGEYIGFCDNDDRYLADLLKDNYSLAKTHNVDLMRYAKIKTVERDDGKLRVIHSPIKDMFIEKREFYQHYGNIRREDTVWTGLYRRSLIEKYHLRFDETIRYGTEDMNFNLKFLMHCEYLGFNSKSYYAWTQRESHSTSQKFRRDFLKNNLDNIQLEYAFLSQICKNQVDNVQKNIFLVNTYVYPLLEYMSIPSCDMKIAEKREFLNKLRSAPIFDQYLSAETRHKVRKSLPRVYVTMKLFYDRRYRSLIFIIDKGTRILAKFRFK